ncbi:MAG: alpha/beta fold hydrolase [Chloroflexi bacterium]|nr:MAG: alpha/beta fold hydrolase [Chloroflexota bacterium]
MHGPRDGWLQRGGIDLHYLEWNHQVEADSFPVLLLHGLSSNAHYWDRVAARLEGRRLIALDQRGHGLTGRPPHAPSAPGGFAMEELLADATFFGRAQSWIRLRSRLHRRSGPERGQPLRMGRGAADHAAGAAPLLVASRSGRRRSSRLRPFLGRRPGAIRDRQGDAGRRRSHPDAHFRGAAGAAARFVRLAGRSALGVHRRAHEGTDRAG